MSQPVYKTRFFPFTRIGLTFLALLLFSGTCLADKRVFCVFDVAGSNGPAFNAMKDYRVAALEWADFDIELVPYTNERIAAEDLKAGQCDAALLTGIRARTFNQYSGSLDSLGGIPSYDHMRMAIKVLSMPASAKNVKNGSYEVAGIIPLGAAYVFVRDRTINSLTKAAGKKVAVLDYDKSQARMVAQIGASPVASDVTNFGGKFNNGSVDVIAAPAAAYQALELYKGLEPNGGIIRFPLAQLSLQLIVREDRFSDAFTQASREFVYSQFDEVMKVINNETAQINPKYWVDIPEEDKNKYEVMMQEARLMLRDEGYYDPRMMTLLRKIRCKIDNTRGECVNPVE